MTHRPTAPLGDFQSAALYLIALGGLLAVLWAIDLGTVAMAPHLLIGLADAMPRAETSGSGAQARAGRDARFVVWRITPAEAQRRFAERSATLSPPTPIAATPANGIPPYAAIAKAQALMKASAQASARSRARAGLSTTAAALPARQNSEPYHAMIDLQGGGR